MAPNFGYNSWLTTEPDTSSLLLKEGQNQFQNLHHILLLCTRHGPHYSHGAQFLVNDKEQRYWNRSKNTAQTSSTTAPHVQIQSKNFNGVILSYISIVASRISQYLEQGVVFEVFFLSIRTQNPEISQTSITLSNGHVHVECGVMWIVLLSATKSELGGLFANFPKRLIHLHNTNRDYPPTT